MSDRTSEYMGKMGELHAEWFAGLFVKFFCTNKDNKDE